MGELDFAERFQERRQVHPETTAIAPAEAIPSADRVVLGATPSFDGAFLGGLLLIGGTEADPVALLHEPRIKVVDTSELVLELRRSDLAEQRGWFSGFVRSHGVGRSFRGGAELPRIVFGSFRHSWDCRRLMLGVSPGAG
jgi:hypothetical protein